MEEEQVAIDEIDYENLCVQGCSNFVPSGDRDKDEAQLLSRICKAVYRHLNEVFIVQPIEGGTLFDAHKFGLQKLVTWRQSERFDPLEIAKKHIDKTLENFYR